MSQKDLQLRKTSVPFTANPFSVNIGIPNDTDTIQQVFFLGGSSTAAAADALRVMRMTLPDRGNLTQAYLNLVERLGSGAATAKVAIGRFNSDGITAATPTQAEIDASHLAITGTTSPFASVGTSLVIDGLNLLPFIPKVGDANYHKDGFVLIIQFSRNLTTSDFPQRFEVACALQMGLI